MDKTTATVNRHRRLLLKQISDDHPLVFFGMAVALSVTIVLCAINPTLVDNITLQSLTAATFAIFGTILYILFMIFSKLVALVLWYIESHHYYNYGRQPQSEAPCDDASDASIMNHMDDDHYYYYYDDDNEHNNNNTATRLPREAVIASMYLGGSGTFLAIPALCMWDISISTAFTFSLLVVTFMDAGKVANEFRANIDTVSAISNLKRLRLLQQLSVSSMLLCILWLDSQDRAILMSQHNNNNNNNNNAAAAAAPNATAAPDANYYYYLTAAGGAQWPLVLLSASSPFLLRGGGTRVLRGMSPSQTIETALPVCTLLAFLVLCWYGPLEKIILAHFISPLSTLLPMLILCPPCLAASLAFILYSLKARRSIISATILTCALFIKQQALPMHHMQNKSDWMALSSILNIFGCSFAFWLYHRKVVCQPTTTHFISTPLQHDHNNNNFTDNNSEEEKSIVDLQG